MNKIDDGGPAYPFVEMETEFDCNVPHNRVLATYGGMSLRDYFAGQALVGSLAAPWHPQFGWGPWSGDPTDQKLLAESAYRMADAMLKARKTDE